MLTFSSFFSFIFREILSSFSISFGGLGFFWEGGVFFAFMSFWGFGVLGGRLCHLSPDSRLGGGVAELCSASEDGSMRE